MRVVQKYGGTSVGSVELIRRVAARVHALRDAGHEVAVVVSAMGDSTDRLLDLAKALTPDPDRRELDQLLATGEQVSIALLAMALRERGCAACSYAGFQVPLRTTHVHGRARIESIGSERLEADLAAGIVPVIAGFQGIDPHGDVTTIGRGGSDTTAVAVAVALRADECQILTDVDGVYTTDPRMVPGARRLDRLTFEEMLELAGQGSRVLHLRSVEFASRYGVRLRVLSSFRPEAPGTLITNEESDVEAPVVAGIAFNRDEAQVTVRGVPDAVDVAWRLLEPVSAAHIEVDMIVAAATRDGRVDFTFTVNRDDHRRALELVRSAVAGQAGVAVEGDATVAKLSAVGVGMRSHAGVATRLFAALAREGIPVRLVSTSEIKISVLVAESALERAVQAVHDEFELGAPAAAGVPAG
jgi:aspartate kinase